MSEKTDCGRRYTQNRELSWLKFNERVLEEAGDPDVPLLERLKFVSIFISNLDEFFMIRVGSLFDLSALNGDLRDNKTGMTPREQLEKIYEAVRPLYHKKTRVYNEIKEGLQKYGVSPLDFADLEPTEIKFIKDYYRANIKPILSPQIVDSHHPFPHIPNKEIYVFALLKHRADSILGLIPVPKTLPPVVFLPGGDVRFIRTEKIIYEFADEIFGKYGLAEKNCVCVTRNANINPEDTAIEDFADFRNRMRKLLQKRNRLSVVRLEANYPLSEKFVSYLCGKFDICRNQIFISDTALKMGYVYNICERLSSALKKQLTYPEFYPQPSPNLHIGSGIMRQIKQKDVLLSYPYESMEPFLQLIREASSDPSVISIKITIYRLASRAKLIDYLCAAAENGKDVTVLMELRARFDEQNNIDWSDKLEESGCKIIYGFDEYKVHSKVCLITVKEKNGVSYITQIGTGNYNEKTAELYTDLSFITASREIGLDASEFFKNMSIGNLDGDYKRLLVAPVNLKSRLIELFNEEIKKGPRGSVIIKVNSLTDIDLINKLAEASKAGVSVKLIIRGICCILPKIAGETDNITVISIVGRFLEHSRIYSFGEGEDQKLFIASADMMTRNTERRVEVACPIYDRDLKRRINRMLEAMWYDNVKARILCSDGNYVKKIDNRAPIDSQMYFAREAEENALNIPSARSDGFFKRLYERLRGNPKFSRSGKLGRE